MHIEEWIERISKPNKDIGGFAICPYAKQAYYDIIYTNGANIDPPPWEFDLIIYVLPEEYTKQEVEEIATEYNKLYLDLVFLPDPKDRKTFINGVLTSNGKQNLILCQYRKKLNDARARLANTDYYSYWNEEYLKEILNT